MRDISGSWAGNLTPQRMQIPPLTPEGQKRFSLNKPETAVGTGHSNDPMNTCDPIGIPRNLEFESAGLRSRRCPRTGSPFSPIPEDMALRLDGREARTAKERRHQGRGACALVWILRGPVVRGLHAGDRYDRNQRSDWLDKAGYPHSVNAMIEERYTRVDHNHMNMVVTVDDPTIFTKPFTLSKNEYRWIPDQEAEEQICVPSEMIQYMHLISNPAFGKSE